MLQETIEQGVDLETARWQARVDLAAAHRLCVMHGFNEGIFNHLTFRVPGTNDRYYQIPFGLYWSEVTASCFMEVELRRRAALRRRRHRALLLLHPRADPSAGAARRRGVPHPHAVRERADAAEGPAHPADRPDRNRDRRCTPPTTTAMAARRSIPTEGERLAGIVGDKKILMMASHGVATITPTISEAFDLLYYTERAAQVQIYWRCRPGAS